MRHLEAMHQIATGDLLIPFTARQVFPFLLLARKKNYSLPVKWVMSLKVLVGREFSAAMWKLGSICVQQQFTPQRSKQGRSLMFATGCILW
jgi:hypothetical protein